MAKLVRTVFVRDVEHGRTVILRAGEEPESRLAALVTNPDAWEDGKAPAESAPPRDGDGDDKAADAPEPDDSEDDKPAAKKQTARKAAARKPAAN